MVHPHTPVLVGVGQAVAHWDGATVATAPSPDAMRRAAARAALADTGVAAAVVAAIDRVMVVRTMADSIPGSPQPFGRSDNPPGVLAADLGIDHADLVYSTVGGDQPQALVNEAAAAIHAGAATAVLIAGGEATAAMKTARRRDMALDWHRTAPQAYNDRGTGDRLLSRYEVANGLGAPIQTYAAFEHALRARLGRSRAEHLAVMAELLAGFSQVAARHPMAQFPQERTAAFLATPSADNYPVADPYLKRHVAQDAVNQGAAVILTSVGTATRLGIAPARWIYLHGHAQAAARSPSERADLSRSPVIAAVLAHALASSGRTIADVAHVDLYSCFPCAVLLAAAALGLDWRTTPATVTGGLPFFGGAGNSYSLHAIATLVERLRADPTGYGLVLANGGFLSKEAAGVYSAQPVADWHPVSSAALQRGLDEAPFPPLLNQDADAVIATYAVTCAKGEPDHGYVVADAAAGRIVARVPSRDRVMLARMVADDPIGRTVRVIHRDGVNLIDAIG